MSTPRSPTGLAPSASAVSAASPKPGAPDASRASDPPTPPLPETPTGDGLATSEPARSGSPSRDNTIVEQASVAEKEVDLDHNGGEVIWVEWDGPDDPNNPLNWSKRRKWAISIVGIIFAGMVSVNVSGYSITTPSVERELHVSHELAALGVTFFTLTFGAAPLVLSPLSEVFGRNPIYLISSFMAAIWLIPQALAPNITCLLFARLLLGVAGSTGVNLIGGTLADVWSGPERGFPMSLFVLSAIGAVGVGPVMFGYAEARYGFRMVSWCWFAASAAFFVAIVPIVKETRATVLLSKKAARLRRETGDARYQTRHDAVRGSFGTMMRTALSRPIKILFLEPVVVAQTLWIAFAWGVLYMCLGSITIVFEGVYGFSTGANGMVYSTQAIGALCGLVLDKVVFSRLYARHVGRLGPEANLYTGMGGGVLFPVGCWIYGLTARESCHWIGPVIGLVVLYTGNYLIFLNVYSYLSASYTLYSASALASMNVIRNGVAAVFPLFTSQMYANLGVQNAGILTAALATGLSAIPFVLFAFGARLRARSPFAKELAGIEQLAWDEAKEAHGRRAGGGAEKGQVGEGR